VKFLVSNGLIRDAARQKLDYAPLDNTGGTGDIRTDLGDSAFLPLRDVIKLHYTNPELFSWCDR
jgi:hypothetical protein